MPESAEIKLQTDALRHGVIGRTIEKAETLSGRYIKKPIAGFDKLVGYRFDGVMCYGKLIVFLLRPPEDTLKPTLTGLSTLGMTGWWVLNKKNAYVGNLKHARLQLTLNDRLMTFVDQRNFGTFKLGGKDTTKKKINELGPDIGFDQNPSDKLFERLARYAKRKTIAEAMLDQRIFAGVGNYIRADAMYNARIDPRTPALDLTRQQVGQLWTDAFVVANVAYAKATKFQNSCYGLSVDAHGNPIESYQDRGGRTVWWCPAIQARK